MINISSEQIRYCGAPSWSWASAEGQVRFLLEANDESAHIEPFERERGSLLVRGLIQKISTLRLAAVGSYYGGYENFQPWQIYPSSMQTFVDDPSALPTRHQLTVSGGPTQLVDVWFLYLGKGPGLILSRKKCADKYMYYKPSTKERLMSAIPSRRPFQRLGIFLGWDKGEAQEAQFLLV